MAGTHEGYSLGIKANYAQVEEAKKATTALYSALGDVEHRAKNLHMGANLPREINHIDTVTASYIRRLESEGKTYEANKQKVNAYQGAIGELSKKQNELKSALDQAEKATGRNSDAYRTQRIKINENVAEINRYKAGLKSANEEMHQANPNFWDKVKSHLHGANVEAEKTHRTFKEVFAGSFLGNAVSNGLSNIGSGLKNAYEEGMNLNLAVAKINDRFKGMGMSTRQTQSLDKQISDLKANTTMTGNNAAILQAHMLSWSAIGTKGAMQMAKTIAGVGDSSKLTGDQIEQVSATLQRVGANGKVTYPILSRITKAAPTFMAQLAKGAGMSQSKMIALLKTGKVTQKQFQGWMAAASKYSDTAFKGFGKTQAGALKQMQVARQKLEQQFTKPIFNAKTSGLQALKNIMTSKTVMSGANQLGKAISNGIGFLDKHKSDLVGITKNVISFGVAIGKATWKDFAAIIQNIGKSLGIIHGNGEKSGDALHTLKLATDGLAKNKTAVQWVAKAVIAMAAVKGLKAVTNPLVDLGTKGVHTFQVVRGISRGLRGITDAKKIENMGKLETHFFNIGKGARSAAKWIKKATGKMFSRKTTFKSLSDKGKIAVGVSAIFSAAQIGNDFYQATTATTAKQKIAHVGAGIGATLGGAIGGVLGGPAGAQIGVELGQAMGPKVAQEVKSALGDISDLTNKNKKGHDIRNKAEKAVGSNHNLFGSGNANPFTNPAKWYTDNLSDAWTEITHIGDKGFWKRQARPSSVLNKHDRGTWLGKEGLPSFIKRFFNPSYSQKKSTPYANFNTHNGLTDVGTNGLFKSIGNWWHGQIKSLGKQFKPLSNMKVDWGPFNLSKWLPKINAKKWGAGIIRDAKKGMKGFPTWTRGLGKKSNKWFKDKWSGMQHWGNQTKSHAQKGWHGFQNWSGDISFKSNKLFRNKWRGIRSWSGSVYKGFRTAWSGFQKWSGDISSKSNKWFKSKWRGIGSWSKGIYKGFQSGWNGLKNWLGNLAKGAIDLFKKPFEGLSSWVNQHIPKPVRDVAGKIGNGAKGLWNKVTGKAHAKGGLMLNNHSALVGEAGPELAYKPYASHVRLLGANGPEFTKVHSGEHILNAHDTIKVLGGGLGHGMVLKGYANGTEKLGKTKKTVTTDYKQIADKSSKSLNMLSKKSKSAWSRITRQTGKDTSKLSKLNKSTWRKIVSLTGKDTSKLSKTNSKTWRKIASLTGSETSKTKKMAISHYSDMRSGIHKQMAKLHDGVISLSESTARGFGKAIDKTTGFARNAMKGTIGQINKGISGIDKVLGQFGGNTSVIKPVKFATGTDSNGRLTQDTYAMVNDATNGPRQEALVSDRNEIFMPRGNNVKMMIPKGWGVLNGVQTLQAGLQHFAQGSGLSHDLLRKLAEKAGNNPIQSFKDMFLSHLKLGKTDLGRGSTNLASNSGKHFGNPWSAAMWTVINNAIGGGAGKGGTREAFLKYAESTFSGVPYEMGAMSKALSDCSGMIAQALKHFGLSAGRSTVDMQHSSALHYLGKSLSNTIPGDLVIFGHGTGAAGHVGIIKNPQTGTMFNETPPHARVTRISDDTGMGYGFYRVKGLHNASASKKTVKSSKRLETLAKRELGSSALKWIKDKLGDEGSLGGNIGGEGVKRWAGTVKRVLGMLHLSTSASMVNRVLRQINTESGGNPHAIQPGADPDGDGSGPALGLMQTKRETYEAFKRKGSGGIFNGPADLYAGLNYAKHRYGPSLSALGNGHGYAKGGKPSAHTPFIAGEHGPELITADGPVKVDTHEQTKHKLSDLINLVSPKINRPAHKTSSAPIININFNGPIGGSVKDAKRIAEIVKREITQYLVNIGDEFGTDPSLY